MSSLALCVWVGPWEQYLSEFPSFVGCECHHEDQGREPVHVLQRKRIDLLHDVEHEIYVLEGKGKATLDGRTTLFSRDSFLFIPGGVMHTMVALEDLKLICIIPISAAMKILGP